MPYSLCEHLKWAKCNCSGNLNQVDPRDDDEIDRVGSDCAYLSNLDEMHLCPKYSGYEYSYHRGAKMEEYTVHIPEQTVVVNATSRNSAINKAKKLVEIDIAGIRWKEVGE